MPQANQPDTRPRLLLPEPRRQLPAVRRTSKVPRRYGHSCVALSALPADSAPTPDTHPCHIRRCSHDTEDVRADQPAESPQAHAGCHGRYRDHRKIMRALGSGPDDIEGAVVHWLGKRLYAAYEVLEHND
jgi:hypothetical protein